jgi:ribonuclease-3
MRSRLRTESSPSAARQGRPLELVRVRGTQRHSSHEEREIRGRRRRGGRGRSRGPRPPTRPQPRPSFWDWLKGLFRPAIAPRRRSLPAARAASLGEQEARVIAEFCQHYKLTFNRPELLKLALTHRSYLSVTGQGPRESNERLEFLGDSVLGLVTSDYLYTQHPNEHEGQLTKTKSLLVSKAILSRRGLAMGLGRFVLMSHSEIESGGRQRLSIIADAFESVIGAIYLDLGFEAAREYIQHWLLRDYREIAADKRHTNYKSHLQEYVQTTFRTHPVYRIRSEMGPDHSKQFMVEVMVGRRTLGTGRGRNKKEAEQAAARDALEKVQERPSDRIPDAEPATEIAPDPRVLRGPREPREPRTGFEARTLAVPVPEAAAAPPQVVTGEQVVADDEGAFEGVRRRRGRRGGRGRRARIDEAVSSGGIESPRVAREAEPGAPIAPESVPSGVKPAAAGPAAPPARTARSPRRLPRAATLEEARVPEVEPLPPAYEEDENEEIGRPEGPLEERHIDPYALVEEPAGRAPAGSRMERGGGRSVESSFMLPTLPEPEDEWPADLETEQEEPRGFEVEAAATEPASEDSRAPEAEREPELEPGFSSDAGTDDGSEWAPSEAPGSVPVPTSDEPRFGRRPGRAKRRR